MSTENERKLSMTLPCLLCCLLILLPLQGLAFPMEVFDERFQFIRQGDINIGAILSIHRAMRDQLQQELERENIQSSSAESVRCKVSNASSGVHGSDDLTGGAKSGRDKEDDPQLLHSRIRLGSDGTSGTSFSAGPTTTNTNGETRDTDNRICGTTIASYQSVEDAAAVLFALEQINARSDILPNITLGAVILDDCSTPSLALARSLQFLPSAADLDRGRSRHSHPKRQSEKKKKDVPHQDFQSQDLGLATGKTVKSRVTNTKTGSSVRTTNEGIPTTTPSKYNIKNKRKSNDSSDNKSISTMTDHDNDISSNHVLNHKVPSNRKFSQNLEGNMNDSSRKISRQENSSRRAVQANVTDPCASSQGTNQIFVPTPSKEGLPPFYDVTGVIGAYTSSLSIVVADVMSIFRMPQISHASTVDVLSDKSKYPYFFRTLPPDRYHIRTLAELIHHFGWTFISMVYSEDPYGQHAERSLRSLLQAKEICIAKSIQLADTMTSADYDGVIDDLREYSNARVVLLYADIKHIQPLMTAVKRKQSYREFLWVGSDSTSVVSSKESANCDYILGSLSVGVLSSTPPEFLEYFENFVKHHVDRFGYYNNEQNESEATAFDYYSQTRTKIMLKPGKSFNRAIGSYTPTFAVSYAIDAVYAFAYALHNYINQHCPNVTRKSVRDCLQEESLLPYLKTVKFRGTSGDACFNDAGDAVGKIAISQCQMQADGRWKQVTIGAWDMKFKSLMLDRAQQWPNGSGSAPVSVCAEPCPKGFIYTFPKQTCCWKCIACKPNEITTGNKTRCVECGEFHWPDGSSHKHCLRISPSYVKIRDLVPLVLAFVAVLGLMMSVITAFTFYQYRSERIIRSSSRELSYFMLLGIFSAFLLVFSLLVPPTELSCCISHVGFGMTFTLVYAPLLVKTNRIYRIFKAGRKTTALPRLTSSSSQLLIALLFILMQVVIVTVSTTLNTPRVTQSMPVLTEKHVAKFCDMPLSGFLSSLAFNLVLVLVCTWYAFKTRQLPDNYNESRYIAFCVDTTLLVWATFIPTYFTMTRPYYKVIILALALLINSIVCLLCLFVPKLYALYMSKRSASSGRAEGSRSDFNIQMVSNTSVLGVQPNSLSHQSVYQGDIMNAACHVIQSANRRRFSNSLIQNDVAGKDQEIRLLTSPDDILSRSEANSSFTDHSNSNSS